MDNLGNRQKKQVYLIVLFIGTKYSLFSEFAVGNVLISYYLCKLQYMYVLLPSDFTVIVQCYHCQCSGDDPSPLSVFRW